MIANPNDGNSPRVEVATPIIDVSAGGLITATTEQEAGYVPRRHEILHKAASDASG